MTKSHNPQFRDDETRYVRYAPCLCFRFLQTCQYATYVVLLSCVIYIFFSVTSWYPSTSSTSVTPAKHPHFSYRPKPNGFRPSGFGLRMKQSHGYHRSMFHNKGIFSGNVFNPWMRKKMKSNVSPFTIDDVLTFPKKNLMAQDRKSDNNRKVFPLESGGQYKYAGADRRALDMIYLMSTKSPKRPTGTPSQARLVQTGTKTKPANTGKAPTIEERIHLSIQSLSERGLRVGPKRKPSNRGKALTIEERTRLSTQGLREPGLQRGPKRKPADRGKKPTIEERTRLSTQSLSERGLRVGPKRKPTNRGKVLTIEERTRLSTQGLREPGLQRGPKRKPADRGKKPTIEERTRLSTQGLSERGLQGGPKRVKGHEHFEGTETKQPRVMSKSKSEDGQLDTGKLSGKQHNVAMKLPIVKKDYAIATKGPKGKNPVTFEKVQMKKMRVDKHMSKRLKGKSDKNVFSNQPRVLVKQQEGRRGNHKEIHPFPPQRNLRKLHLLHDTKVIPKTRESLTSTKGNFSGESVSSVQTRLNRLKLRGSPGPFHELRSVDGTKPQQNRSREINQNKADKGLPKGTQNRGKQVRIHIVGKLITVKKGSLGRTENSSRLGYESNLHGTENEGNGGLLKIDVHKRTLPIPKNEHTRNDRTKLQQKRLGDPKHVVRGQGRNGQRCHGDVSPHNDELRQDEVRGRQVIRGEGHNIARGYGDVRPRDDVRRRAVVKDHGEVRGQGHDSAQSHTGVRARDKVRPQDRLRGHNSTRGHDSVRGNTIGKDHVGSQFGAQGDVDLRGHKGLRGHAGQRGHYDAESQGDVGTKVDQWQQAKPTGTKYTRDKMESNPIRSRKFNAKTVVQMITRSARPHRTH